MIKRYLVKADTVGEVRVLLSKEVGVLLLQGAVVHDVVGVADHVRDHIRLIRNLHILEIHDDITDV